MKRPLSPIPGGTCSQVSPSTLARWISSRGGRDSGSGSGSDDDNHDDDREQQAAGVVVLLSNLGATNARFQLRRLSTTSGMLQSGDARTILHEATWDLAGGTDQATGAGSSSGDGAYERLVARFLLEAATATAAQEGGPQSGAAGPELCVVAVCGSVLDGVAHCASQAMAASSTGGAWRFTEDSVSAAAGGARTVLINDFVAVGHALEAGLPDARLVSQSIAPPNRRHAPN
jgi:hypothetical protein